MIKYGAAIFLSSLLSTHLLIAQSLVSLPLIGIDEDATIQIGLQYNYIQQNYQLQLRDNWKQLIENLDADPESITYLGALKSIYNKASFGHSLGISMDIKWNERLSINFNPSFNLLNAQQISYESMDDQLGVLQRKTKHTELDMQGENFNSFEFPVGLKFYSDERNLINWDSKYRAYILGGVRLARWAGVITQNKELSIDKRRNRPVPENIILKPEYMSWEVGVGFDLFFTNFRVSPEVRFSQSMNNVLSNNHVLAVDNKFMAPIDRAFIRNVYFSLIFQ